MSGGASQPHPFEQDVPATAIPFALWSTEFKSGSMTDSCTLDFKPVAGAYVACFRVSTGAFSRVSDEEDVVRFGRTNEAGWLIESDWKEPIEPEIGPPAPKRVVPSTEGMNDVDSVAYEVGEPIARPGLIYGLPNEVYTIFWSYDEVLFESFVSYYRQYGRVAFARWGVSTHVVQPFGGPGALGNIDLLTHDEVARVQRLLFPAMRVGYHAGYQFANARTDAIFDVTPEAFRNLFLCEWLQWCCERFVHDDKHWPYLLRLMAVIRATQHGAPMPDLAKHMPAGGAMAATAQAMRDYVYKLAKAGCRSRGRVVNALRVTIASTLWRTDAEDLARDYGVQHPALKSVNLDTFLFAESTANALIAYYDVYVLGFIRERDLTLLEEHWQHVQRAYGWVREKQQAVLRAFLHTDLERAIARHLKPQQEAERKDLRKRYLSLCAAGAYPFWEAADEALAKRSEWDIIALQLKWGTASADLAVNVFGALFDKYISAYQLTNASVESLVRFVHRYDLGTKLHKVDQTLPTSKAVVRLEYAGNKVIAKLYAPSKTLLLGEYEFLTNVASASPSEAHTPLGATSTAAQLRRFRRAVGLGKVREFKLVETPLTVTTTAQVGTFLDTVTTIASLIKATIALTALADSLEEQGSEAAPVSLYFEAGEEAMQAVKPTSALLAKALQAAGVSSQRAQSLAMVRGAARLGVAGGALASVHGMVSGVTTLSSFIGTERHASDTSGLHTSTTELAEYFARGQEVAGWMETSKGVMQVAVSGASALELLGVATTCAAVPMAVLIAVGSVVIASIEIAIWVETGGASPVDAFLDACRMARLEQFALTGDDNIIGPNVVLPLRYDGDERRTGASRLAKRFGALHALVDAQLKSGRPESI